MRFPIWVFALWPFAFAAVWLLVTRLIRAKARMNTTLPFQPGPPLRETTWGSAMINGARLMNCVKVEEHPDGWLLRAMRLFGNGMLWLPKEGLVRAESNVRHRRVTHGISLTSGEHSVVLFDHLADFVR